MKNKAARKITLQNGKGSKRAKNKVNETKINQKNSTYCSNQEPAL